MASTYKLTLNNAYSAISFKFNSVYEMENFMEKALENADGHMAAKIELVESEEKENGSK